MKKLITLVIALVMIFTVTCVIAEAELTFQGVQWYSSPEETIKHLNEVQFTNSGQVPDLQTQNSKGNPFFSHIGGYKKDKKIPYRFVFNEEDACMTSLLCATLWDNRLCKTIAKQSIKNVSLYYNSADSPQLIEVCIWFDQDAGYDANAVYEALVTAYGKPAATRKYKKTTEHVWTGGKNTIVIMYNNDVVFATLDGLTAKPAEMTDTGF